MKYSINKKEILLLTFCSILMFNVQAFIDFRRATKDNIEFLFLGDLHIDEQDPKNKNLSILTNNLLDSLFNNLRFLHQTDSYKNKVNIIYELNPEVQKHIQEGTLPDSCLVWEKFKRFALQAKIYEESDTITIKPYEPRGFESEVLADFLTTAPYFYHQSSKNDWPKQKAKFLLYIPRETWFTVDQFLKNLDNNLLTIQDWKNQFEPGSIEYKIFESGHDQVEQSLSEIKNFLTNNTTDIIEQYKNLDIREHLFNFFDHCKTRTDFIKQYEAIERLFALENDYVFANLGFLYTLLKEIDKSTNSKIIFFGGCNHTDNLCLYLELLGYNLDTKYTIGKTFNPITSAAQEHQDSIAIDSIESIDEASNDWETFFQKRLNEFFEIEYAPEDNTSKTIQALASKALPKQQCGFCKQRNTHIQLRCSRCKKVFYCNQVCQKKDWPHHKLICK